MQFKHLLATILALTIALSQFACSDPGDKKEKHYKRALEYIKIDDDKAAVLELRNAIQLDAKFADARYQLGLLYLKQGNPQAAFGELQRSFSLDGKNLDAGVKVAEFYLLSRDKEQTRKYVEQVLAIDPEYRDALALLANLELIEGNYDKALAAVDKALLKDAENDKLFNIKGRILMAENKMEEARQNFLKAIELNPDFFANYRALLMFYEQQKDDESLQTLLDEMVAKFPEDPQLHVLLAGIYLKRDEPEKAETEMVKAVDTRQDIVSYRLMLADFYKRLSEYDKAETVLKKSKDDFPEELQVVTALAEILFEKREFDDAKTLMDEVLAKTPGNGAANLLKARFFIKDRKNQQALEILTPLMTDYPKWADPFYYAALTYLRVGNPELAQKSIELALKNSSGTDRYHALAAQIYLLRGSSQAATKEASLALRLNPRNGVAIKILAKSFIQAKQFDKAVQLITSLPQQAVDTDPELLDSLSMGYLGLNDKEKAVAALERLITLTPDNGNILAILTALTAGEDIGKSIDFVQNHLKSHESGSNYLVLGDLYNKDKRYDEALQAYSRAKELNPDNPQSYIKSAHLLNRLGKTEETIAQFQSLLAESPDSITGLMGLAAVYESSGNHEEAKAKYIRVLELAPDQPLAANNLAWLLASEENGDLGEALRLAMLAKQALPDSANVADTLGWVHYQRKSYSLAIPQYEQALQVQPQNGVIRYHLALAQWENGSKKEAVENLAAAIEQISDTKEKEEMTATLAAWESQSS